MLQNTSNLAIMKCKFLVLLHHEDIGSKFKEKNDSEEDLEDDIEKSI